MLREQSSVMLVVPLSHIFFRSENSVHELMKSHSFILLVGLGGGGGNIYIFFFFFKNSAYMAVSSLELVLGYCAH